MGGNKTDFKIHVDKVLNLSIPDVSADEVDSLKDALENQVFKGCRFLFQKYDADKRVYIADVKIMRKTETGGKDR